MTRDEINKRVDHLIQQQEEDEVLAAIAQKSSRISTREKVRKYVERLYTIADFLDTRYSLTGTERSLMTKIFSTAHDDISVRELEKLVISMEQLYDKVRG